MELPLIRKVLRYLAKPRQHTLHHLTPFPLNYGPLQVVKNPRLVLHELKTGADPMDPLATLDFDELAENGKSL